MEIKANKGKLKGYGLVRDKEGNPKFNDINNIPRVFWDLLTEKEQEEIQNGRNTPRSNT